MSVPASWRIDLDNYVPLAVGTVELRDELAPQCDAIRDDANSDDRPQQARVLLRIDGQPIGYATAPLSDASRFTASVRDQALAALSRHLEREADSLSALIDTMPPAPVRPVQGRGTVTIAIPTRNRTASLQRLLDSIDRLNYRDFTVLVVDNAPTTDSTYVMVRQRMQSDSQLRYEAEPRRGGSHARNCALRAISSDFVLFADDDTVLDRLTLDAMLDGFERDERIGCVTGFVASWELDTLAKARFDQLAGWGTRFVPRVRSLDPDSDVGPAYPYTAGVFGAGAVYAFRCEALKEIGVFDTALGPGTHAHGAEDLDMFVRTILSRWSIAYEPSMVAWHENRPTDEDLRRQVWGWGVGLSSYVTKLLTSSASRTDVWRRIPAGIRHARTLNRRDRAARLPAGVVATQLMAWTYGPIGYARSRLGVRRDAYQQLRKSES
jgi:GT2 family glycosyltransferase